MRVRVTPPFEGAGAWEDGAAGYVPDGSYQMLLHAQITVPVSWCKPIPELVAEPGDICEFIKRNTGQKTMGIYNGVGDYKLFINTSTTEWDEIRVLARRPMEWGRVRYEIEAYYKTLSGDCSEADEKAAYEKFLSTIIGGAEYVRVEP